MATTNPQTRVGRIGRTYQDSEPWYEEAIRPPAGSPNIVLVLFDDTGYADFGCYGSEIRTPTIDRLAAGGARYTNFHTTTLCSPTRASLLTGRNHHSVGMRMLANNDTGWPSGRGRVSKRAGTIAEMLKSHGYNTWALGKWHLAPMDQAGPAGPFDHWPLSRGFNRFYGFMDGATDQFSPELISDNHPVRPPRTAEDGYHITEDLVDQSIHLVADQIANAPNIPFFLYLAPGATHAPHQAPAEFIERYRGVYDRGYDVIRRERFARQLELGVVPEGTELPEHNPDVIPWEELTEDQQRISARFQEAYAGFLEHTDHQLGRLVDFLEQTDQLDNTVFIVTSDNGAAMEGGAEGAVMRARFFNSVEEDLEWNLSRIDDIGSPRADNHYPRAWAEVSNTPGRWYKYHTHAGGVRDPFIVHWAGRVAEPGSVRSQFHHVVDVVPTLLEGLGLEPPETVNGVPQMPVHGTSMLYSLSESDSPTRKQVQYFEMFGNRAIWMDGWKAVTKHSKGDPYEQDNWELYHLDTDFSEVRDLAKERPDRLAELMERWWYEAGKYDVLPLDDRTVELWQSPPRPSSPVPRKRFVYYPQVCHIHPKAAAPTVDVSYTITADIVRTHGSSQGVLISRGDVGSGYVLYIQDGRLVHEYNFCGERYVLRSPEPVPLGRTQVQFEFRKTGTLQGHGHLHVNGKQVADGPMPRTLKFIAMAGLDIGADALSSVSDAYEGSFPFSGHLERITIELGDDRPVGPAEALDD